MLKTSQRSLSSSRDVRFGSSGTAARRQAIDSMKAIANVTVAPDKVADAAGLKADEAAIVKLLREQLGKPALAISAVAKLLAWPAARTAEALSGACNAGLLRFLPGPNGTTSVELTER
jgi:hypothetical protein